MIAKRPKPWETGLGAFFYERFLSQRRKRRKAMLEISGFLSMCALASVLLLWGLGLYSRLQRLRSAASQALSGLETGLRRYSALVLPAARQTQVSEPWQQWAAVLHSAQLCVAAAQAAALEAAALQRLSSALRVLPSVWQTVCAQPADLAGPAVPPDLAQEWQAAHAQLQRALDSFNQAATQYNTALGEAPSCWLAPGLGFVPVGCLDVA